MADAEHEIDRRLAEARAEERRWRTRDTEREARTDALIAAAIAERNRLNRS